MKFENLEKLFVHELKDLYSAENQLLKVLPKMIDRSNNDELRQAFQHHLAETKQQVGRLETIFAKMDFKPRGEHCKGMAGLIAESEDLLSSEIAPEVLDAALISAAQRFEHYEMAGYGTARAFAQKLGHQDAADLLQQTLEEEGVADRTLSRLAEKRLNFEAMTA
ncbi:MAG: ferritin-like domain-containing protein [Acidobacteria bacterium]|nr:MAG: ferritin-like domain-containing protein [Acidobacteriota bacterium]REK01078.1 MAG: ferritin-like domain-containing protein [Acidobacteriota bacterium]